MGSGKYLRYSIEKHGIENFTKEILFVFDNPTQMYNKEAELVNENFLAESNTYNLKVGGSGGWDYINSNEDLRIAKNKKARKIANENGALEKAATRIQWLNKNDLEWRRTKDAKIIKKLKTYYKTHEGHFAGKKHSTKSIKQMSDSSKGTGQGKANSQFGTCWIYNIKSKENKRIKKADLAEWILQGWTSGRKIKN